MMGTTHQHVGVATAVGLSAACGLPWSGAAVVVVCAAKAARTPDSSEQRFRVEHRTVTHWLLTCVAMAVLPVLVLVAIAIWVGAVLQYGWDPPRFDDAFAYVPTVMRDMGAEVGRNRWSGPVSLSEFITGGALIIGFLAALGRCCGMVAHTLADACTPHGSPLWGVPGIRRSHRPVHLLPYWARVKTDSVDDSMVGLAALGVTLVIVYLTVRGFALPTSSHS